MEQLSFVSGYLYRMMRHESRNLSIRWTALMVLRDLQLLGPCTQRALASVEQVSEPTMTVLLKQMQKDGWIARKPHPDDVRAKLIEITPEGRAQLMQAGGALRQALSEELNGLSEHEIDALASALEPLTALLMRKISDAKPELTK